MSSLQSLDIARRSATNGTVPQARSGRETEVAKLIDVSSCIGCKACQVACMQWNDLRDEVGAVGGSYDNPKDLTPQSWTVMRFSEVKHQEDDTLEWLIRKDGCMHCADPGCLKACPSPGAIVQYGNGIVDFISEHCIGCGYCISGCPFNIPRLSKQDNKVYKCSLCSDRVGVGLEPACAKSCPTGAIRFGSKEDMKDYAVDRIADLNERGYANAGLYDPPGVGGTHVMYVLQHADRPELYHGLARDPRISPTVALWKGGAKALALFGMGAAVLAGFFHYMKAGPMADPTPPAATVHEREAIERRAIRRYDERTRLTHWAVALLFFGAALSGLALFHPALFGLSALFGGGVWDRILHPYMGVLMVLGFGIVAASVWRDNRWKRADTAWLKKAGALLRNREDEMPPVGRYNAGQKLVFWASGLSLAALLVTGFLFWQPWFAPSVPIPLRRIAALVHAVAAFVLVLTIIIHIYSAIWVKGTLRAMTRGTVTDEWARHHHPLWHREVAGTEAAHEPDPPPQRKPA